MSVRNVDQKECHSEVSLMCVDNRIEVSPSNVADVCRGVAQKCGAELSLRSLACRSGVLLKSARDMCRNLARIVAQIAQMCRLQLLKCVAQRYGFRIIVA